MLSRSVRILFLAIPALFLASTTGPVPAQGEENKTTAISGNWKGNCIETTGYTKEIHLELAADDTGKVTGKQNGLTIENGVRIADTVAWSLKLQQGKVTSLYLVFGRIHEGGKKLILEYTFVCEAEGRLQKHAGTAIFEKN